MSKDNNILIAEDDEMIRKIIEEVLGEEFELIFAEDGKSALEKAKLNLPELIILDIMMPEMNGFEVCKAMRKVDELNTSIIIIVTALSDKDSEKTGLKAGADDFLTKPFNPIELRTKVQLMFRLRNRLLGLS
ncbi:MAG: PleD family two-component system response regulator [Bacteroidales bacterium]